ncbi:MAG TPA: alpha/beta hydrolase [Xanthobacteraceae bacterium]|nr:alpha/beta hydrolase [Xanthobacteraceae bacterium]
MQDTVTSKTEYRADIVYAVHDGVELKGDLYLPAGSGPFPLIVNVHGGYWRRGSRDTYQYWGPYLGERGYAGFTISYRLTKPGRKTFPEAVHDVRAAVQFMRGNAKGFRLNPDRFALWGNSAGAQLAALTALAGDSPAFAGAYPQDPHAALSTSVKVLIGVYGIYDLLAQWRHAQITNPGDNLVESYLGCAPMADRHRYFEASPLSYAITANNKTAVYLSWGTEDDVVDYRSQSLEFLLALKQAGFNARSCVMQGAPHYWLSDPIEEPMSHSGFLAPRLLRFLAERL